MPRDTVPHLDQPPHATPGPSPAAAPSSTTAATPTSTPAPGDAAPRQVVERPNASFLQVAGAVFWSFFGVRKGRHMQQDTLTIKPAHVVIVGLLAGLVFVLALVALVSYITRNAA